MSMRATMLGILAAWSVGCAARTAQLPVVAMHFYESPPDAAPRERLSERSTLSVAVIGDATLRYMRPAELLKAAEVPGGGDPRLLMRAARTLSPASGVVLLGTARATGTGGGATDLAVYQLALACERADLEAPGDLKGCAGYVVRSTREWPAEVYGLDEATVAIIPEGGTARGRVRAKSGLGVFRVELEGEFSASIAELAGAPPPAQAAPEG